MGPVAEQLAEQDAEEVAIAARRLPEQELVRRQKLDEMRERGFDPYAVDFQRDDMIDRPIRERFADLEPDARTGETVRIAGRVMLNRITGKLFRPGQDWTGQIQVMLSLAEVGQEVLDRWKHEVDLGDHVGVVGQVITSKRGELSVLATEFTHHVRVPRAPARTSTPDSPTRRRGRGSGTWI